MEQIGTEEKDVSLIAALAAGKNVTEAAAAAGLGRTTVYRRLARRRCRRKVARLRQ